MYKIILENGETVWFNERIIMQIIPLKDRMGHYSLIHFNRESIIIKSFQKI